MLKLLTVNPPEYYPIIDKLFAGRIKEAVEAFGASLEELTVFVQPEDRVLNLIFFLKVRGLQRFLSMEVDPFVYGLLEKLASDATETFGKVYGVRFSISGFKVVDEHPHEQPESAARLVVNGPDDMRDVLERLGKGLMITLREWNVRFSALAVTVPIEEPHILTIVLKMEHVIPPEEKVELEKKLRHKTRTYLKTLTKRVIPVEIKILDPEDKTLASILRRKIEIEKEAEELAESDEVRELMNLLGKETPGS
ncbi:hypothetical protein [Thermococcus sp. ES12]|uniref:hypothetical protein n=1 Tax=Thermococcus sp. ES12 TaxID=1638246 RepID=UPI0014314EE9|nr:hypothetical protein [Thermococcus sp. ES12]NJE76093.1 hypothetical protein [Thermococcus sp. ES12]